MLTYNPCNLCPRACGVDREVTTGFCGCGTALVAARAALHFWEEPCISGTRGSGTIFFSGCNLRCCYCQNHAISLGGFGKEITAGRLAEMMLSLQAQGAHNINLVTATPHLPRVLEVLELVKPQLTIPVVYNTGGYETIEAVRTLKGHVDVFLPDLKYYSAELATRYSSAPDYFEAASAAIAEMIAQTGAPQFDAEGLLQKGVVIRHLVLPGSRKDSFAVLRWIAQNLPAGQFLLSLMRQYTPTGISPEYPELGRKVTSFEYESVVDEAMRLGLTQGFTQRGGSAEKHYTPPFDLEGI